ncbi:S-methyl-5'-thioadenosine phosphorylase [Tepidiforma sp.]|uniref:S-methyl-5'-thioadenosine phosphorylase n=1 Tax=Tepidiforma sp. TaxID=2682230 RepID=UPI002ADDAF0D|nr:S-methyl-5'-thioadenosine phosphorylase [Tepidiforma sp.]
MSEAIPLAVIGGSGFYAMPGLEAVQEVEVDTPFGRPSDAIRIGMLEGVRVAFLARHGRGHTILPSELPQRANFWALKSLGVERVLAVSAVGSLREAYAPGNLVVPSQLIDRTWGRPSTFFGEGVVAHIAFAEPFCARMRAAALTAARDAGAVVHDGGVYVVMQGPAFSTRAESELHRSWGADLIGMTALPEAKLAREAELCYATLACVTDYDCWHETEAAVDASAVFETLQRNVAVSQEAVRRLVRALPAREGCPCGTALDRSMVTRREAISPNARERLAPILRRWLETGV